MSKSDLVIEFAKSQIGSPYVFGAWGDLCTPSLRRKYAGYNPSHKEAIYKNCPVLSNKSDDCEGCKYEGKLAFDCRGFTHWCFEQVEIDIKGGGATTQYNTNSNWSDKGGIDDMPDVVCCVFKQSNGKMQHTGVHIGGGIIIHCSVGVQYGKITDKGWTHYAIPNGMEEVTARVILRKGSQGDAVKELQERLNKLGYDCGVADGKYGDKTATAVRQFQHAHGLSVDGIAGDKTQAQIALEIAKLSVSDGGEVKDDNLPMVDFEAVKTALKCIKSQADETAKQAEQALRLLEKGGV